MSSRLKCKDYLAKINSSENNKSNKIKSLLPSKPYYLKGSSISKMLKDISFNKSYKTISNSFYFKEKNKKKKTKLIYVKKNNNKETIYRNNNKENINLNFSKEFRTLNNDNKTWIQSKKINLNKNNQNSKNYNLNEKKQNNEIIIQDNNTTAKKENNKESIKSKISELSSLKKIIFENGIFSNFQFFKTLRRNNNSIDVTNSMNNRNTINYFHKLNNHKKTKTVDIKDKCITDRSKFINYLNIKFKNKLKESRRNSNFNSRNNDFTNSNSLINDNNKTQYITIEDNQNKQNIHGKIKFFHPKIYKSKIFDKKKLLEKLAQSQLISTNKNEEKNYYKFSITPSLFKDKFVTKIKQLNITKKVIKIVSCSVAGKSPLSNITKINQDSYYVQKRFLNLKNHFLLTLSDGYGPNGHLISKYFCNILPSKINNISDENIQQSIILTKELLFSKSKIDFSKSGASVCSIIITPEKIISSNKGTCKSILALNENDEYTAINITNENNIIGKCIEGWDSPYIQTYFFKGNEKFIILATNGLWEFINNDECIKIIKNFYENGMDANGALESIVRLAISRWKSKRNFVDDITAILLFFD